LVAAGLSGFTILRGVNPHDEGLMLQAAARVVHGQLPYQDFWWNYGPGQPLLLAGLQEVFGPSLLAWRILRVALDALSSVLVYALARREGATQPVAIGAWIAAATALAWPLTPNPNSTVLALALGAIVLAPRWPLRAGLLGGLAVCFRPDMGLAAAAGALLAAIASGRRAVLAATAGATVAAGASLLPFVFAGGPGRFLDQTAGFALHQQSLQRLPLPGAWNGGLHLSPLFDFYFPYVLIGGLALWLLVAALERPTLSTLAPLPLTLVGLLYLLARVDEFHLIPLTALLPLPLAVGIARARRTAAAIALALPLVLIALHGLNERRIQAFSPPTLVRLRLDVADGVRARPADAASLVRVVHYVRRRVEPGQPVFVANPRHDLVRVGDPLLYVLLQRPNPTRYDVMQPGVITERKTQRGIVASLQRARPKVVVRWLSPLADQREPNGSGRSSGVHVLDGYLANVYRPLRRFGDYLVLARRPP
jgi:hypothetical protein